MRLFLAWCFLLVTSFVVGVETATIAALPGAQAFGAILIVIGGGVVIGFVSQLISDSGPFG